MCCILYSGVLTYVCCVDQPGVWCLDRWFAVHSLMSSVWCDDQDLLHNI